MRLRGLTILLVEDDVDNLELLTWCLEAEGACVLAAGSLSAAWVAASKARLDVVVCDLELPDGDGGALLERLRQREELGRVPAIAISGYSQHQRRSRASARGFDRFAAKPFSVEVLIDLVVELKGDGANATF